MDIRNTLLEKAKAKVEAAREALDVAMLEFDEMEYAIGGMCSKCGGRMLEGAFIESNNAGVVNTSGTPTEHDMPPARRNCLMCANCGRSITE